MKKTTLVAITIALIFSSCTKDDRFATSNCLNIDENNYPMFAFKKPEPQRQGVSPTGYL